jgi:high-affinity Fe2+/Pb2+ permease
MRDLFSAVFSVIFACVGGALLYDGVSGNDVSQSAKVIGGAALLVLGLMIAWVVMRNWVRDRRIYRNYRGAPRGS